MNMKNTNKITQERLRLAFNNFAVTNINKFWIRTIAPFQSSLVMKEYDKQK